VTRTFIALEMSESLQRHLEGIIRRVAQTLPEIRWVDPIGIHLTLAFLGELTDAQVEAAMRATEIAAQHVIPFPYSLSRLGIFGSSRQPRVIWMGIEEPSGALNTLHRVLNAELEQHGFEVEKRPFSPHFTLARIKAPLPLDTQHKLDAILARKQQDIVSADRYFAQQVDVFKSELLRPGPRYSILRSYKFGG
jgi:2'-5' RNA ligase